MSENNIRERMVGLLEAHPEGMTILGIAQALELNRNTVTKYVYELSGAGVIVQRKIGSAKLCFVPKPSAAKAAIRNMKNPKIGRFLPIIAVLPLFLLALSSLALPAHAVNTQSHPLSELTPIDTDFDMMEYNILNLTWANATSMNASNQICIGGICRTSWPTSDTNNMTGAGSQGYLAKWANGTAVNASEIFEKAGNVGIGTASPQSRLEVAGGNIRVTGQGTPTSGSGLELEWDGTWGDILSYDRTSTAYLPLRLRGSYISLFEGSGTTTETLILRIDGGNVGIGTGTSTIQKKLDVVGDINATGSVLAVNSGSWMNATSMNASNQICLGNVCRTGWPTSDTNNMTGAGSQGNLSMWYNGTALNSSAIFQKNGNVGIGTTSPVKTLDVIGTINATSQYCLAGVCASTWPIGNVTGGGAAGYVPLWQNSSQLNSSVIFQNGTQIGINIVPNYTFVVSGTSSFTSDMYFDRASTANLHSNVPFTFLSDSNGAQTVKTGGLQVSSSYSGTIPDNGILFGTDTNLYSSDANVLKTDDSLIAAGEWLNATSVNASNQVCIGNVCRATWPAGTIGGSGTLNYISKFTPDGTSLGDSMMYETGSSLTGLNVSGNMTVGGVIYPGTKAGASQTTNMFYTSGTTLYIGNPACCSNIDFLNNNIQGFNSVKINDAGVNEGFTWTGTSAGWIMDITPLSRTNADGNLNLYGTSNNIIAWRPLYAYGSAVPQLAINSTGTTAQFLLQTDGTTRGNITADASGNVYVTPGNYLVVPSGNVGIGTASPGSRLHLYETGTADVPTVNITNLQTTGGDSLFIYTAGTGTGSQALYVKTGTYDPLIKADGDRVSMENLAIGTSYISATPVSDGLMVQGKVGIGTTAPVKTLDVVGDMNATAAIFAGTWVNATNLNASSKVYGSSLCIGSDCRTSWLLAGGNTSAEIISAVNGTGTGFFNLTSWKTYYVNNATERTLFTNTYNASYMTNTYNATYNAMMGHNTSAEINAAINSTFTGQLGHNTTAEIRAAQTINTSAEVLAIAVSRTDWTTHDSYPAACAAGQVASAVGDTLTCVGLATGNNMTGAGVAGYIPLWYNTTALNSSIIFQNGTNIGVGRATSIDYKLEVDGSIGLFGSGAQINWNHGDMSIVDSSYNMLFLTYTGSANTEKMRITGGGNVGIGTTSPTHGLQVVNNVSLNGTLYVNNSKVGIGTTSPGARLEIAAPPAGTDALRIGENSAYEIRFTGASGTNIRSDSSDIYISAATSGKKIFLAGGASDAQHLTITQGNVGIGQTNPANPLNVLGSGSVVANVTGSSASGVLMDLYSTTAADAALRYQGSSNWVTGVDKSLGSAFIIANANGFPSSTANDSKKMVITTGGDVGIGTTAPVKTLDVVGDINATSEVCIAGDCRSAWPSTSTGVVTGTGTANYVARWLNGTDIGNTAMWANATYVSLGSNNPNATFSIYDSPQWHNAAIFKIAKNSSTSIFSVDEDGDIVATGSMTVSDLVIATGSDVYDNSGPLRLSGEDDVYVVMDYNNNDADTRALYIGKNSMTNPTLLMVINESGRIGMGLGITNNTQKTLDVVGDINATGSVLAINSGSWVNATSINASNHICVGNVCRTDWPTGNTGNVTGAGSQGYLAKWANGTAVNTSGIFELADNVGIGTTTPTRGKLEIRDVPDGIYGLTVASDFGGRGIELLTPDFVYSTTGSALQLALGTGSGDTYSYISAYTAGKSAVGNLSLQRDGGNVGIGTTTPTHNLQVFGNVSLNDTLYVNSSRVGIGTSTPATGLDVATGKIRVTSALPVATSGVGLEMEWDTYAGVIRAYDRTNLAFQALKLSGSNISLAISGSTKMYVDEDGQVGIGTTTPLANLEVKGDHTFSDDMQFTISGSTNGNKGLTLGFDTTTNIAHIYSRIKGDNVYPISFNDGRIYLTTAGKVGIGTTNPNGTLSIGNNVATGFLDNYNEYQLMMYNGADAQGSYGLGIKVSTMVFNSGGGAYSFDKNGASTSMAIDTSGDVGIGTTAPNEKLEVIGNMNATGSVIMAGTPLNGSAPGTYGLAGYWTFENGAGSTVSDSSMNANHGTTYGSPVWVVGKYGDALNFTGPNEMVVPDKSYLKYTGGGFTVAAWVKPLVGDSTLGYIASKAWNGGGWYNWRVSWTAADKVDAMVGGATTYTLTTDAAYAEGVWHHVVATYGSDSSVRIYVDGNLAKSGSHAIASWVPGGVGDNNVPLAVANIYPNEPDNLNYRFNATMDELRIYNTTLSAEEVRALYVSGADARFATVSNKMYIGGSGQVYWDSTNTRLVIQVT